jgi:DNA-binding NarL/FixJ family response regulator
MCAPAPCIENARDTQGANLAFRILIADDEPLVRAGVRLILESHEGWVVCGEAENGQDAIDKAAELQPDMVVLDLSMPEMDGLTAAPRIRAKLPSTPIVILTLYESLDMARWAASVGAAAFVAKSLIVSDLIPSIEALRGSRQCAAS